MWTGATGKEYERGNNCNASNPAVGEFVDAEMAPRRAAGSPAGLALPLHVRAGRASLADLDRLYRSLSTRLGINFKGKYKFCIKDLRSL